MKQHMQFHADQSPSLGPKSAIIAWYVVCAAAAAWLGLVAPAQAAPAGHPARQAILLACAVLYVSRAAHTLFVFVRRSVPWWEAAWGGSIIGVVLFFFLREGLRAAQPLGVIDAVAVLLYLAGSYLGTASEHTRHAWKADPAHRGHIYTGGLFGWSRHINYFGDLLLFSGFGLLTTHLWTQFVPLGMACNFIFVIIPAHDAYLAARYGEEFARYAERSKRLIPMVY
jgi:protein-S-isoprenylcysteine O-methyltransferase Ste14